MGANQIDMWGNQNLAAIGDWRKPKAQLLGLRGAPGNVINHTVSYWIPNHSKQVFCEKVDVVSGPGYDKMREIGPAGSRFFDWIAAGKRVYTDLSWAIGFAPYWLAREIERRGAGHDRVLFASDRPWGDAAGERARMTAATGDGELGDRVFHDTFVALYD